MSKAKKRDNSRDEVEEFEVNPRHRRQNKYVMKRIDHALRTRDIEDLEELDDNYVD